MKENLPFPELPLVGLDGFTSSAEVPDTDFRDGQISETYKAQYLPGAGVEPRTSEPTSQAGCQPCPG